MASGYRSIQQVNCKRFVTNYNRIKINKIFISQGFCKSRKIYFQNRRNPIKIKEKYIFDTLKYEVL